MADTVCYKKPALARPSRPEKPAAGSQRPRMESSGSRSVNFIGKNRDAGIDQLAHDMKEIP